MSEVNLKISKDLYNDILIISKKEGKNITEKIEELMKIERVLNENSDLTYNNVKDILQGINEAKNGKLTEYKSIVKTNNRSIYSSDIHSKNDIQRFKDYQENINKLRKKVYKKEKMILPEGELKEVPLDKNALDSSQAYFITRVFINNRIICMVCDDIETSHGKATKVMVQRLDNSLIPKHWQTMQKVKNTIFGKESIGIEYYPKESELSDIANIYWLWVFEDENALPKVNIE